jgi:hypothetical protein
LMKLMLILTLPIAQPLPVPYFTLSLIFLTNDKSRCFASYAHLNICL